MPEAVPHEAACPPGRERAPGWAWPISGAGRRYSGGWPRASDLSSVESAAALREILEGAASASQMAAFIFGLRCKGETSEELTGMLGAMLEVAETVPVPDDLRAKLVDTCGTGGDRAGTINVSTIAALVVAGAGVPVCKHGGRAASSRTGSADVLEALGVEIALPPRSVARCIEGAGIGFCFAPRYHPAMRHVGPTRRELGVPTAFNLLGPLANPGRARYQLVGVGDGRVAERVATVLGSAGAERAWVVHGHDGLDELSTAAPSTVVEWRAGRRRVAQLRRRPRPPRAGPRPSRGPEGWGPRRQCRRHQGGALGRALARTGTSCCSTRRPRWSWSGRRPTSKRDAPGRRRPWTAVPPPRSLDRLVSLSRSEAAKAPQARPVGGRLS